MKTKVRFINVKYTPALSGRIKLLSKTLKPLASPPARIDVELMKSPLGAYWVKARYEDAMGSFFQQATSGKSEVEAYRKVLVQLRKELRQRELCLTDGYPPFIPSFAS